MRIRSALLAAALTGALAAPLAMTTAAQAAPTAPGRDNIEIDFVYYDSPGWDNGSWRSLNGEYVVIENNGRRPENLARYSLSNSDGVVYRFNRGTWIRPGQSLTIHTGPGRDWWGHAYIGSRHHIWDNDRDRVVLRNGWRVVDVCGWYRNGRGFTGC